MFDPNNAYPYSKVGIQNSYTEPLIKTYIFKFKTKKKAPYIVRMEEYPNKVFMLKFHLGNRDNLKDADKYKETTKDYDAFRVLATCLKILIDFYKKNREANFGIMGEPYEDETFKETIRYRIYSQIIKNYFSDKYFIHSYDPNYSFYFLLNKIHDIESSKTEIVKTINEHYLEHFTLD